MEYRTRRERREAEKAGLSSPVVNSDDTSETTVRVSESSGPEVSTAEKGFQSRRDLRERNRETLENQSEQSFEQSESTPNTETPNTDSQPETDSQTTEERSFQGESDPEDQPLTAKSYIYQESSNTVTIDSIPDSLSPQTGDFVFSNSESIEVVTGSHPSLSAVMDDLKYDSEDQKDTVTGRISLVDPVSAKLVADSREPEVIVPGKIVVKNRAVSITFAVLGGVMFVLAGIGLWWALSEMGPFSS